MKRLFTIITLLVSSFFLFSINEVKADTYEFSVDESQFDLINDDFYAVREYALNYVNENNGYYAIFYSLSYNQYRVYLGSQKNYSEIIYIAPSFVQFSLDSGNGKYYKYVNNNFELGSNASTLLIEGSINNNNFPFNIVLDYNFSPFYNSEGNEIKINYNNLSYIVNSTNSFPSLYQIYLDSQSTPVDKYEEDKIIITSFYTMITEKFAVLANLFIENYVFVLILTIIILIFLLELIFRRLL